MDTENLNNKSLEDVHFGQLSMSFSDVDVEMIPVTQTVPGKEDRLITAMIMRLTDKDGKELFLAVDPRWNVLAESYDLDALKKSMVEHSRSVIQNLPKENVELDKKLREMSAREAQFLAELSSNAKSVPTQASNSNKTELIRKKEDTDREITR